MGFFGDLYGSFTGSSGKKQIEAGKAESDADLDKGLSTVGTNYGAGRSELTPYATGGQTAYTSYLDSLGLNGADKAKTASDAYFNNPVNQQINQLTQKANTRAYTAQGMGNSGASTQGLTNALLKNWQAYQSQLSGAGQQGQQAATGVAGLFQGEGDAEASLYNQKAGNAISSSNALAKNSGTFANNLISLAGAGAKAYSGMK